MKFVNVPGTRVLFSVWKTRVQDFAKFVAASRYDATRGMLSIRKGVWGAHGNSWRTPPFSQDPTHPVCGVSWIDAKAFCEWLTKKERLERLLTPTQSYRLPHEAEWNAAVGTAKFPWGEEWPPPSWAGNFAGREVQDGNWPKWAVLANHRDPYPRTSPVGSFAANRYGIYDLGGNLWEWCQEPFGSNPKVRVLRGSSWMANYPDYLLSSARRSYTADCRRDDAGFRIVLAKTEEMKP